MSLRNRVALITGGSRGIGRGIAVRLAKDGARVAIAYRSNKAAAQQTLLQLQASGADSVAVETDITDAPRAEQLLRTVVDRFGRIDVVVNNVGDFRWATLAESSLEDWQSIFSSNLMTVLYMSRAALPPIRRPPTVEDVAAAVAFFASDEAEYVTGQVVNVSGGWML